MQSEPQKELIVVNEDGTILLPEWVQLAIIKKIGLRSKKKRIRNKVIKREFIKLLEDYID